MDDHPAKRQKTLTGLPTPITPISPTFKPGTSGVVKPQAKDMPVQVTRPPSQVARLPSQIVRLPPQLAHIPPDVVHICAEGDAIIVVKGVGGLSNLIGLRVSTEALSLSSPVLKLLLAEAQPLPHDNPERKPTKLLSLTDDDGESMFTLLNMLLLKNSAVPARLEPIQLSRFVEVATKYECIRAVSRAATPWFDYIFTRFPNPPLYQMTQAALILGDAIYFARFSSRWVLHESLSQQLTPTIPMTQAHIFLAKALLQRQKDGLAALRVDIDDLVQPLSDSLASEYTHYVDSPPGDNATPVELGGDPDPVHCVVDKEGAVEYLGALRDAKIWPATRWPNTNLLAVTEAIAKFQIPEYDSSENCHYCSHVEDEFAEAVNELKEEYQDKLWGLCLECFLFKGIRPGRCTYEHDKCPAHPLASRHCGDASGSRG